MRHFSFPPSLVAYPPRSRKLKHLSNRISLLAELVTSGTLIGARTGATCARYGMSPMTEEAGGDAVARTERPPERVDADVCVVGAGYAGLTAARRLSQQGRSVIVLEAR